MAAFEVIALDTATPQLRAPGASDTYTFPRAVEMPLGTANGVLFLNGSKVVSSGSGLTFDGTSLGIGTSSPSFSLDQRGDSGVQMSNAANSNALRFVPGSGVYNINMAGSTHELVFADINGAVELMRLTPTGLGIGTSSPGAKLQVLATGKATIFGSATAQNSYSAWQYNGADVGYIGNAAGVVGAAGATDFGMTASTGGKLWLGANNGTGTTYAVLDTSGNLGLGATPSAWGGNAIAFTVKSAGSSIEGSLCNTGADNATAIANNAYYNAGWKYVWSGGSYGATRYDLENGQHRWYTAPSGTAGNAISFTQALTLDASGSLLVGATSSYRNGKLVVKAANFTQTSSDANFHVSTTNAQAADIGGSIGLGGQIGGDEAPFAYISGRKENGTSGNYAGYLAFATQTAAAAVVERLRIKSTGQLRYVPLAADPAGAENGDVYYNSGTNKLRLYAAGAWVDLN
jgi:hypothetical protein